MRRRDISKALFATAAGSAVVSRRVDAQTCTAPCFAQTGAERNAGVTPTNYSYLPGVVDRYATPGTTDMTAAIMTAANQGAQPNGAPVQFLSETYIVASNVTVNVPCAFNANAQITPGASVTVTLNGPVTAPLTQVFNLSKDRKSVV